MYIDHPKSLPTAVSSEETLEFFLRELQGVVDGEAKRKRAELAYTASILAHYATTSTTSSETFPASPTSLGTVFDVFVMDISGQSDPSIMEAAGAQCLLLTGFFSRQQRRRYNLNWYANIGAGYFASAGQQLKGSRKGSLMYSIAGNFHFWRLAHTKLALKLNPLWRIGYFCGRN